MVPVLRQMNPADTTGQAGSSPFLEYTVLVAMEVLRLTSHTKQYL